MYTLHLLALPLVLVQLLPHVLAGSSKSSLRGKDKIDNSTDTSLDPQNLSLSVSSNIAYGSDIAVTFNSSGLSDENWIGIYNETDEDFSDDELWSSMCGGQDDYNNPYCPTQSSGTVTFSGSDPYQEGYQNWPILPGNKKVCIMTGGILPPKALICAPFVVDELPLEAITNSSLTLTKTTFGYDEDITAEFQAAVGIPNTWIGMYSSDNAPNGMNKLPNDPILWVYSACNNLQGDQFTTDNCVEIKRSGSIQFDSTSVGNETVGNWPIESGSFRLCMSFYNNEPYEKFVCSNTFTVTSE